MNAKETIKNLILVLLGNTIYALSVTMFVIPNKLITGGSTGLALFLFTQYHIPVSLFISGFNVLMFLLGLVILGKKFAFTTLVSSFYYPFILEILQKFPNLRGMTSDTLLATVFAGVMIGAGIALVLRAGASTGGMDIPALIMFKKFGLPVSVFLYLLDSGILLSQMLFSDKERILYGILLVILYTIVLDKVLLIGRHQTQVKIISNSYEDITYLINEKLDLGSALICTKTGYNGHESQIVLTVISNQDLPKLNRMVLAADPDACMIINKISEIKGNAFCSKRQSSG